MSQFFNILRVWLNLHKTFVKRVSGALHENFSSVQIDQYHIAYSLRVQTDITSCEQHCIRLKVILYCVKSIDIVHTISARVV